MTRTQLSRAQERLDVEKQRTLRRLASLTEDFEAVVAATRDTNADDEHDPEGATIAFERSQMAALVRQTHHHLDEIAAAMERVDSATYGSCETCAGPIGEGRLDARPVARNCIRCDG